MGHQQPPTPAATDNIVVNSICQCNGEKKISRAIDMIFIGLETEYEKNHFSIFWGDGKKN